MRRPAQRYLAPEQLAPGRAVSERTDLFALGLILYELLVGRPPFAAAPEPPRTGPALARSSRMSIRRSSG